MTVTRRAAMVVSLVLCGLLAFAATSLAFDIAGFKGSPIGAKGGGGGGLFLPAGNYHNTQLSANLFDFNDPNVQISVNVTDSTNVSNPVVGPATSTHEVDVFFNECAISGDGGGGKGGCGGGCFIPDQASDFTISADLSSAVLNTTVTATTASCQGSPVSGFDFPFTLTVTWSGAATSGSGLNNGRFSCGGYTSETMTTSASGQNTTASVTNNPLGAEIAPTDGFLDSFDQRIHAQGTAPDGCVPLGGKGAGIGPQPPGDYHFVSLFAATPVIPDDPFAQPYNIDATTFTNVFHPNGGPATTQSETDLHVFQFNPFFFIRACYILPPGAFTISAQTATLHASIDPSTPMCEGSTSDGLPPSFSLDVTWQATGPTSTFRFTTSSGCGGSQFTTSGVQTTVNANASGSFSGIATHFQSSEGSINSNDSSFHIAGKSC